MNGDAGILLLQGTSISGEAADITNGLVPAIHLHDMLYWSVPT